MLFWVPMRPFLIFVFSLFTLGLFAQSPDTRVIHFHGHTYFHTHNEGNTKLMLFLHGGIENPFFKENVGQIELNYLLEENQEFLQQASANQYDVLIPVTSDSLDWLNNPDYCFEEFKGLVDSLGTYSERVISGFSDGGTGSFKIFYLHPSYFTSLVVFNGYPYHKNFALKADYKQVINQKVIFFGTKSDKMLPYEFMLATYCQQKEINPNTYFYLTDGKHQFNTYHQPDFVLLFELLSNQSVNKEKVPIHGFVKNDQLLEFYKYRKFVLRKYGFGEEYFKENRKQAKKYKP